MARHYSLVTVWHLEDTIEHIWDAITHPEGWPDWWPAALSVVELEPGAQDGVGAERRFT